MSSFLFFLPRYHTNAVPWVRILTENGHRVEIHCVIRGPTENYSLVAPRIHEQCKLSRFLGGNPSKDRLLFPRFGEIYTAIRKADPDVVIVRGLTRWFMRMAAVAAILQRRKLVVYDQEEQNPSISSTWLRRAICRFVGIRHFTPKIDAHPRKRSWGSASCIPFGYPFQGRPLPSIDAHSTAAAPRILMVAKYRERKRHGDLLRALARLAFQCEFTLTFCGEEADERDSEFCRHLASLAAELGISERIVFKNNVPHTEMADLYAAHDVFVLPAVDEPAAVSPLEAAWCGCAVLLASGSGTRGYIPPGTPFEFKAEDVDSLAEALGGLLSDSKAISRAQDACLRRISSVAADQVVLSRLQRLLE